MTLAKSLAGGLPIGAICMGQKVADAIHPGDHASTFAGNPLTTHVAGNVLGRIAQPAFLEGVRAKGQLLQGPVVRAEFASYQGDPGPGPDRGPRNWTLMSTQWSPRDMKQAC